MYKCMHICVHKLQIHIIYIDIVCLSMLLFFLFKPGRGQRVPWFASIASRVTWRSCTKPTTAFRAQWNCNTWIDSFVATFETHLLQGGQSPKSLPGLPWPAKDILASASTHVRNGQPTNNTTNLLAALAYSITPPEPAPRNTAIGICSINLQICMNVHAGMHD